MFTTSIFISNNVAEKLLATVEHSPASLVGSITIYSAI